MLVPLRKDTDGWTDRKGKPKRPPSPSVMIVDYYCYSSDYSRYTTTSTLLCLSKQAPILRPVSNSSTVSRARIEGCCQSSSTVCSVAVFRRRIEWRVVPSSQNSHPQSDDVVVVVPVSGWVLLADTPKLARLEIRVA